MMDTPETQASTDPKAAMAIVACFEGFVNYLYPMLVNTSRQHRVLRDTVINFWHLGAGTRNGPTAATC